MNAPSGDRRPLARPAATLVLIGFALGGLAWGLGWFQSDPVITAIVLIGAFVAIAALLLQRQASERRDSAIALSNAQARVSHIVEAAMDPIISCDGAQRIVLFNAAAEKAFQWPRKAVIGQPLEMLIPERFRPMHAKHVQHFGSTGETTRRMGGPQVVLTALRANGQEFPIDASISHHQENGQSFYTVILRDVTERVQSKTNLERSEARLRGILDSAMDAIITVDERQHVVLFNHAAEAMFKCPQAEAVGAPLAWFIPERYRSGHSQHVQRFGDTGVTSRRMGGLRVVTGLARDGREFPIDASISQLTDVGGKFYTVILRDVTDRVQVETALRASKQELQELASAANAAREQEQSRIARELHDELGQALTALKMMTAWIAQRVPGDNVEMIGKVERMSTIIDSTLKAASRISAQLRPLILDDLGLVPALEWLVEGFVDRSGIQCDFATEGDLELDDARKSAVFRVVQEALTNVTRHAKASQVRVRVARAADAIAIHVRDNGVGFDLGNERSRNSRGLLGMRERAYLLGGNFSITSAPGEGTAVDVRIPLTATAEA